MTPRASDAWEKKLRDLPTAPPPEDLRRQIFARLPQSRRKVLWHRPLAYALCLMFLLAVNIGLQQFQEARLTRLMGDGRTTLSSKQTPEMLLAYLQNRNQLQNIYSEEMP